MVSLTALVALAATMVAARSRPAESPLAPADGSAAWTARWDGLHRLRRDPIPFPAETKPHPKGFKRVATIEQDWFVYCDTDETFCADPAPDGTPRVAVLKSRKLLIPYLPWMVTFLILSLAGPVKCSWDWLVGACRRRPSTKAALSG